LTLTNESPGKPGRFNLDLPWEDSCLQFHQQATAVTTASAVQVREPAHTRSIGRWRRYEKQLSEMRSTLDACSIPVTETKNEG